MVDREPMGAVQGIRLRTPSASGTGARNASRRNPRPALDKGAGMTPAGRHGAGAAKRRGRGEASSRQADGVRPRSCPGLPTEGSRNPCPFMLGNGTRETTPSNQTVP